MTGADRILIAPASCFAPHDTLLAGQLNTYRRQALTGRTAERIDG